MSADDIPLLFHPSTQRSRRVDREELRGFLSELTRRVARGRTITCLIANDAEVRRLNRFFRGKDHATDVLSFPPAKTNGLAGDIAISIDQRARSSGRAWTFARRRAANFNASWRSAPRGDGS